MALCRPLSRTCLPIRLASWETMSQISGTQVVHSRTLRLKAYTIPESKTYSISENFTRDVAVSTRDAGKRSPRGKRMYSLSTPHNAWDSHMHILDPQNFPLNSSAVYKPKAHLLSDADNFESSLNLSNMVLVQPSIYGNDNSCLESALRKLGPQRARAIVTFDPFTVDESTMRHWHEIGVRGVRLNLSSTQTQMQASDLRSLLQAYAWRIRPFNWALQLYIPLRYIEELEDTISSLGIKVVLDHFGHPDFSNASFLNSSRHSSTPLSGSSSNSSFSSQSEADTSGKRLELNINSVPGLPSLLRLMDASTRDTAATKLYIKLSAPYRLFPGEQRPSIHNTTPSWASNPLLEAYTKLLLQNYGDSRRLLFATDWPFTRFDGLDIRPFIDNLKTWCYDVAQESADVDYELDEQIYANAQSMVNDIFKNAAEELWDSKSTEYDDNLWTSQMTKNFYEPSTITNRKMITA